MNVSKLNSKVLLVVFVSSLCFAAESFAQSRPCVRLSERAAAKGATIVLRNITGFPCKFQIVDKGIVLKADADDEVVHRRIQIVAAQQGISASAFSEKQ